MHFFSPPPALLGALPSLDKAPTASDPLRDPSEKQSKALSRERLQKIGISITSADVPSRLRCEIDGKMLGQPVRSPTGHVFERTTLEQWFVTMGKVCPVSSEPLNMEDCKRDKPLELEIKEYVSQLKKEKKARKPRAMGGPSTRGVEGQEVG